jgi:ABC-type polysaccharide transport system permease subunit
MDHPQPNSNLEPMQSEMMPQAPRKRSIAERIWQYKLHYVIVLPALLLILVLKVFPFLSGLYASFRDYKVFLGISGSPWAGWDNYAALFRNPVYMNALGNTASYKMVFIAAGGMLAFAIALALSGIRSGKARGWISSILVIPFVLPSAVLGHFAMLMFSASSSPLGVADRPLFAEEGSFRFIMLAMELLKYGCIPVIIALAAIASAQSKDGGQQSSASFWRMNALPAARAVLALMLLQLAMILTTDLELLHTLINPLVYDSATTVDYLVFQMGFMNMNVGPALAATYVSFALQFALALTAYFLVRGLLRDALVQRQSDAAAELKGGSPVVGGVVGIILTGLVLVVLFYVFVDPFMKPSAANIPLTDLISAGKLGLAALLFFVTAVFGMLVTLTLSYPMTVRRLPGGTLYRVLLIALMGIASGTLFEYMFIRELGMVNTIFPPALIGLVQIVPAFVLKNYFNGKYGHLKEEAELGGRGELAALFALYIPKVWKPLLALGALHFIVMWNAYLPSFIYVSDPSKHLGMMQFVQLTHEMKEWGLEYGDPLQYRVGALLSLPPLVLFLLLRKWIVGEVLIGGLFKR